MNEKNYMESMEYLHKIVDGDIATEIREFLDKTIEFHEANKVLRKRTGKTTRAEIREAIKNKLYIYQRDYFYEKVQQVFDYWKGISVNKDKSLSSRKRKDKEIIQEATRIMEGLLVSATYLGAIEGFTRQNIHALLKKDVYKNHLIGNTIGVKLMDIYKEKENIKEE